VIKRRGRSIRPHHTPLRARLLTTVERDLPGERSWTTRSAIAGRSLHARSGYVPFASHQTT